MRICPTPLLALTLLATTACAVDAQDSPEVKQWQVFEVEMTAAQNADNPYVTYLREGHPARVTLRFAGVSGEAAGRELTVAGFWDGGMTWKARFAPPACGGWVFESRSEDPGLNGVTGRLTCTAWTEEEKKANPTRRGSVRVHTEGQRAGRYFEYADGTPFLWIGDTWWNWTLRGIRFETFKNLVEDRVKKGFNVGQLFFAANGWSRRSSLLDADYNEPDLEHIQSLERWIAYANEKGITVWIHPWWSRARLNETAGPEKIRRWWRYVIHRLAAYNVIWTLAGEYNMNNYGGLGLEFWKDLGAMVAAEDPFHHILGAHPTPPGWSGGAEAPQWSTAQVLQDQPWLDYNQSQTAHARWRNEYAPTVVAQAYAMNPPKPIVITEPWYEFALDAPAAKEIRFCAWSAIMSGAAGHTYGGGHIWLAYLPEVSRPRRSGGGSWPLDPNFETNTFDYPGARGMAHLARILRSVEWWRLEPHPELVVGNPSRYCLAIPGETYLMFLRWGGAVKLDLTAYQGATFTRQWIDLVTEQTHKPQELRGGQVHVINAPEDFPAVRREKDWILLIKVTQPVPEPTVPVWKKNGFGFFLVNGDNDRPDAFRDFGSILNANGIDHEVLILPDTKHNLGLYYERSVGKLLAFLGKHLTKQ